VGRTLTWARASLTRLTPLLALVFVAGCGNNLLTAAEARRLIEASARFSAPDVLTVRSQYCSSVDAPADNVSAGLGRLKALESAGAIRISRRAASPSECSSLATPLRERLLISLGDSSASFHPRILDDNGRGAERPAGWEFTLASRRLVSMGELTFNSDNDPTIARAVYQWAWRAELLGQLLQVSEAPVNAQSTFLKSDGAWELRDVGF
jgi:hypothetical protein